MPAEREKEEWKFRGKSKENNTQVKAHNSLSQNHAKPRGLQTQLQQNSSAWMLECELLKKEILKGMQKSYVKDWKVKGFVIWK